jgi:hypothetical protein
MILWEGDKKYCMPINNIPNENALETNKDDGVALKA